MTKNKTAKPIRNRGGKPPELLRKSGPMKDRTKVLHRNRKHKGEK